MKYIVLAMFFIVTLSCARDGYPDEDAIEEYVEPSRKEKLPKEENLLRVDSSVKIAVVGQGVAPLFASSPAQSYALAKRAAVADAYRLLGEQIKGVKVEGKDTIKNMAIKSSVINVRLSAMIRNATVVETIYKDGLCEVEMEISLNYNNF